MSSAPRLSSLHIIGGKKLGGAERFFIRLVNALDQRGEAVSALTVAGGEIDRAVRAGVPRRHAPLAGVWDVWSRHLIRRAVRLDAPAIVQTYMGRATRLTHLPSGRGVTHVARLGGYYNLHGYHHAHAWVGNTRGICDYLIRAGLPANRVFHIGNFADPAPPVPAAQLHELRREWQIPDDARVVLGLGRLHPNKGFADLLTAFAALPGEIGGQPLRLVMVGDGPLRATLHAQAAQLGIAARAIWTGWQYDPAPWYQLADVFVCSSRHEPLGNVILEAWANGVPVVSTRSEGPLELIEDGADALLGNLADPADLAQKIRSALTLPEQERHRMIGAGRAKIIAQFSEKAIVDAYLELYRTLSG